MTAKRTTGDGGADDSPRSKLNQKIVTYPSRVPCAKSSPRKPLSVHIRLPFIKLCVVARRHNWAAQVSRQQDHHWDVVDFLCQWCSSKNLGTLFEQPMDARAYRDSRSRYLSHNEAPPQGPTSGRQPQAYKP